MFSGHETFDGLHFLHAIYKWSVSSIEVKYMEKKKKVLRNKTMSINQLQLQKKWVNENNLERTTQKYDILK